MLKVEYIAVLNPFDFILYPYDSIVCPFCTGDNFVSIDDSIVYCQACNTRFVTRKEVSGVSINAFFDDTGSLSLTKNVAPEFLENLCKYDRELTYGLMYSRHRYTYFLNLEESVAVEYGKHEKKWYEFIKKFSLSMVFKTSDYDSSWCRVLKENNLYYEWKQK